MSETYNVAVDPAAGSRVRVMEAVFVCEAGRKPFATIEAAQAAAAHASERDGSDLDWHFDPTDGGYYAVGISRNG